MTHVFRAAVAMLCLTSPSASAQMHLDPDCQSEPFSASSCAHVIACIGGDTMFVGGAVGWDEGHLTGRLSTGANCTGTWKNAESVARFECDDGQSGQVVYRVLDGETGTALGSGVTNAGRPIEAWSGNRIGEYILGQSGQVILQCGVTEVPLS